MPRKNTSGKMNQANSGSKSNNWETNTKTEDLALAESMYILPKTDIKATDEDIEKMVVYENGATSIDFMMPEEEREILEKNLNNYSDMEKMQKVLNMAKKNKLLQEQIRSLDQIEKIDSFINNMGDVIADEALKMMVMEQLKNQLEAGEDVTKSIKQLGLTVKAFMDARQGMINSMKANKSGKNMKIAVKFTNDNGEDTELGVMIDGE